MSTTGLCICMYLFDVHKHTANNHGNNQPTKKESQLYNPDTGPPSPSRTYMYMYTFPVLPPADLGLKVANGLDVCKHKVGLHYTEWS